MQTLRTGGSFSGTMKNNIGFDSRSDDMGEMRVKQRCGDYRIVTLSSSVGLSFNHRQRDALPDNLQNGVESSTGMYRGS